MFVHPLPVDAQRRHWYAKVIVGVPVHVPTDALSVWPSTAVPEITGGDVFAGGAGVATTVAAELELAEPAAFVAVTATRNVEPTSPDTSWYVAPVAPATSEQFAPAESHRRHWKAYVMVGVPVHVPVEAVSVWPSWTVPVMVGGRAAEGGAGSTRAVRALVAGVLPAAF